MQKGDIVKLYGYGGQKLILKLVQENKDTLFVCQVEEYEKSKVERRAPIVVGFNRKYLIAS